MEKRIELKIGNILDRIKEIPDNSIDCIVTSPPYYGLRSYKGAETIWGSSPGCEHEWISQQNHKDNLRFRDPNHIASVGNNKNPEKYGNPDIINNFCSKCGAWKGQLGLEPDYKMYLSHLLIVTSEIKRVLKPTGTLWWNMGDSYAGNMGKRSGWTDNKINQSKEDAIQNGTAIFMKADYGMPSKSLMQLPTRFAIRMVDEQGWILRNTMIWKKRNHMPSSVRDRLSNSYEFIFFFTKQKHYFFNLDAVRVPNKVVGVTDMRPPNILRQKLYLNSNYNKSDDPHLAQFKTKQYKTKYSLEKTGQSLQGFIRNQTILKDRIRSYTDAKLLFPDDLKAQSEYIRNVHDHNTPNLLGKNPGDVLELTTQPFKGAHFAVFPPKLPEFCIKAGSPKEVCSVCGKPKVHVYEKISIVNEEKPLTGKHTLDTSINSPGNRAHYITKERKYTVNQKQIAMFIEQYLKKEKIEELNKAFGETRWPHWIRTDDSGAALPSSEEYKKLKEILGLPNDHDIEMMTVVDVSVDDKGNKQKIIGTQPTCSCNASFKPGVVLDPFAGSGTTMFVAKQLGRSAIGIEISPEYAKIIKQRLEWGLESDIQWVDDIRT